MSSPTLGLLKRLLDQVDRLSIQLKRLYLDRGFAQVAQEYRHRFGIEASYRLMNAARAVTTSPDAALRLLLVALAFLLSNLWVWLKWNLWILAKRKALPTPQFSLRLFELFIIEAIKDTYGVCKQLQL